jgi:CBS domain-containing protein
MAKLAKDVMTPDPACCSPHTSLDQVAKMMILNNCGEIPIVDAANRPVGVITDRDIVCRIVAEGKNPMGHTAEQAMTAPVVSLAADETLDAAMAMMASHHIRRLVVVDDGGACAGIIAQADVVSAPVRKTAELLREISTDVPNSTPSGRTKYVESFGS